MIRLNTPTILFGDEDSGDDGTMNAFDSEDDGDYSPATDPGHRRMIRRRKSEAQAFRVSLYEIVV